MDEQEWRRCNYDSISRRLARFKNEPPGILFQKRTDLHDVMVEKVGSQLRFIYKDPTADEIMSRIDVENPLNLLALYTQAMMLTLMWVPQPRAVYNLGFGGGRLPLVLHHFFPQLVIENTDIEAYTLDVAKHFFAIELDERMNVAIQDGREYLSQRLGTKNYDIIFVDAFRSTGYGPYHLATMEFFGLCKNMLTPNGIVSLNLLSSDQLYADKIYTFTNSFKNTFLFNEDGVDVLFGTDADGVETSDFQARAADLDAKYKFPFPLTARAQNVMGSQRLPSLVDGYLSSGILTDSNPPPGYFDSLPAKSTIFKKVGRNERCPCGSGKKFKSCHGSMAHTGRERK